MIKGEGSAASMSCISLCHNKRRFLAQIEEIILSMKLQKNHNNNMAFLSRILALGEEGV
jgi:hypothetical protein